MKVKTGQGFIWSRGAVVVQRNIMPSSLAQRCFSLPRLATNFAGIEVSHVGALKKHHPGGCGGGRGQRRIAFA